MFDCRWEMGGRQSTKLMKRKGYHGASGSSCRRLEGLESRAHTKRVVFNRKRKEREGEGSEQAMKKWWKDCGSGGRKIREFSYDGYSFFP